MIENEIVEFKFREKISGKSTPTQTYGVYMGNLYLKRPNGMFEYLHYPSEALQKEAKKHGYTGTIAEKVAGNIHVYGNQLGTRANTLKNK